VSRPWYIAGIMIQLDRGLSPRAPRWALLLALMLAACSSGTPDPARATAPSSSSAAPTAAAPTDESAAQRIALVAVESLGKRKFDTNGCVVATPRFVTEAVVNAGVKAGPQCSLLVARRADKTWLVLVRAAQYVDVQAGTAQAGSVQALVIVTPGGEGVTHIDYKP
jgi:hypothetical protein